MDNRIESKKLLINIGILLLLIISCSSIALINNIQNGDDVPVLEPSNIEGYAHQGFVQNVGQLDNNEVLFYAETNAHHIEFFDDRFMLSPITSNTNNDNDPILQRNSVDKGFVDEPLIVVFKDTNPISPTGSDTQLFHYNEYIGNNRNKWYSNIPIYKQLIYWNIYNGIDLFFYIFDGNIRYDFHISPGANPSDILLHSQGHDDLFINSPSEIIVYHPTITISHTNLKVYYSDNPCEKIPSHFSKHNNDSFYFYLDPYDTTRPIIIDPILTSTLIGGINQDSSNSIIIDDEGFIYLTGFTSSIDFPTNGNLFGNQTRVTIDVIICKFDNNLKTLLFSTRIGGSDKDEGIDIALDSNNNLVVVGLTHSDDFPISERAYQSNRNGLFSDMFLCLIDKDDGSLINSTYIGGESYDEPKKIFISNNDTIFIVGFTASVDFPTTSNAYLSSFQGGLFDGFMIEFSIRDSLIYSSYLGGSDDDVCESLTVDTNGLVYITGGTFSTDFPTISNNLTQYQSELGDIFIYIYDSHLHKPIRSTRIGGMDNDIGMDITIDKSNNIIITGSTRSDDLITFDASYQKKLHKSQYGSEDAFVMKVDNQFNKIIASTYLGGSRYDFSYSVVTDRNGNICIMGYTKSNDFPIGLENEVNQNSVDATRTYVINFDNTLSEVKEYMIIGDNHGSTKGMDMIVDSSGSYIITGKTSSLEFPISSDAYQSIISGEEDIFIVTIKLESDQTDIDYSIIILLISFSCLLLILLVYIIKRKGSK